MKPRDIEDKILTEVQAALDGKSMDVKLFEGTQGSLTEWLASVQLPAVAIWYDGRDSQPIAEDQRIRRVTARFQIWIIHDRLRGYLEAMREKCGLYDLMEDIEEKLQGSNLNLAIEPLYMENEDMVLMDNDTGRIIWGQRWGTGYVQG